MASLAQPRAKPAPLELLLVYDMEIFAMKHRKRHAWRPTHEIDPAGAPKGRVRYSSEGVSIGGFTSHILYKMNQQTQSICGSTLDWSPVFPEAWMPAICRSPGVKDLDGELLRHVVAELLQEAVHFHVALEVDPGVKDLCSDSALSSLEQVRWCIARPHHQAPVLSFPLHLIHQWDLELVALRPRQRRAWRATSDGILLKYVPVGATFGLASSSEYAPEGKTCGVGSIYIFFIMHILGWVDCEQLWAPVMPEFPWRFRGECFQVILEVGPDPRASPMDMLKQIAHNWCPSAQPSDLYYIIVVTLAHDTAVDAKDAIDGDTDTYGGAVEKLVAHPRATVDESCPHTTRRGHAPQVDTSPTHALAPHLPKQDAAAAKAALMTSPVVPPGLLSPDNQCGVDAEVARANEDARARKRSQRKGAAQPALVDTKPNRGASQAVLRVTPADEPPERVSNNARRRIEKRAKQGMAQQRRQGQMQQREDDEFRKVLRLVEPLRYTDGTVVMTDLDTLDSVKSLDRALRREERRAKAKPRREITRLEIELRHNLYACRS